MTVISRKVPGSQPTGTAERAAKPSPKLSKLCKGELGRETRDGCATDVLLSFIIAEGNERVLLSWLQNCI
jgi:hypothetical protein